MVGKHLLVTDNIDFSTYKERICILYYHSVFLKLYCMDNKILSLLHSEIIREISCATILYFVLINTTIMLTSSDKIT